MLKCCRLTKLLCTAVLCKYKTEVGSCRLDRRVLWLYVQSSLTLVQYLDWVPVLVGRVLAAYTQIGPKHVGVVIIYVLNRRPFVGKIKMYHGEIHGVNNLKAK